MPATEVIYREYRTKLLAFIRRRVGSRQAAEDILQDVFVKLLTRRDTVKQPGKLHSWLYQVTRNAIIDHRRASRRFETLPDELPAEEDDSPAARELARCLEPLIQALPDMYRDAVRLSEIREVPLKQVARAQKVSLPGAKSRVQRGRRRLKEMLMDCCRVEVSRSGQIIDYEARQKCC